MAFAFGERNAFEASIELTSKDTANKAVWSDILMLYSLDAVNSNLGYFLKIGAVTIKAANGLQALISAYVKKIAPLVTDIIESMNVPTHALYAPAAADYIKYNEQPNYGEVINARM